MPERKFTTFYLEDDFFGIDIQLVREIHRHPDVTHVALAPDCVSGLLNLRGQIVTIIDLAARLGRSPEGERKTTGCVILKTMNELEQSPAFDEINDSTSVDEVGLLVDRIGDVITVNESEIEPPPAHAGKYEKKFINGVIKLQGALLITLKTSELLNVEDILQSSETTFS